MKTAEPAASGAHPIDGTNFNSLNEVHNGSLSWHQAMALTKDSPVIIRRTPKPAP